MKKLIISLGNPLKRDDNIGNLVLDQLKKDIKNKDTHFIKGQTNPENFIGQIKKINPSEILFIDAILFDGKAGDVRLFKLDDASNVIASTHSLPLDIFKEFFPDCKISLIGIKPKNIEYGEKLSPELGNKIDEIVKKVKEIIL